MAASTSKSAEAKAEAATTSLSINCELDFNFDPDHLKQSPPPYDSNSNSTSTLINHPSNNTEITMASPDAAAEAHLTSFARYKMDLEAEAEAERSCCEFGLIFGKVAACGALTLIFLFALGGLHHIFKKV
ncbi:hypothetical protein DL95DRAFT_527712 [Leptodontidium sp. 2 PMI_412]|nr:hypothetical protein DL95DRAFT_527712 [Leptodontidium sp. 2 PMI_412]